MSGSTPSGQRTISSFFAPKSSQPKTPSSAAKPTPSKPKPAAKPKPTPSKKAAPVPPTVVEPTPSTAEQENGEEEDEDDIPVSRSSRRRVVPHKRSLEEEPSEAEDDDDDLYAPPPKSPHGAKKLRRNEPEDTEYHEPPEPTLPGPTATASSPAAPHIPSSRFAYDPTQRSSGMDLDPTPEDPARTKQKQQLREKFVKKLHGRIDIRSRGSLFNAEEEEPTSDAENAEDEEPAPKKPAPKGKKGVAASKKSKLTPLEKQVVDIKHAHPDTVLVVEVGYKFRFFGEDARIASQNLSIMCIPGKMRFDNHPSEAHFDKFASASIPVPRLHVHVKRLVEAGYKVGVVRQLETAALKAAGDNRNAPFERKLTDLYTKGTYIDDIDGIGGDISAGAGSGGASNTGFLLCITEKPGGGSGTDEKCHVGIVAVQPSTGEVLYDEFDDGFMRSEIETRLLHIAPCEFLIVGELTKATEKIVSHLAGSTTTVLGDRVRVERVKKAAKGGEAEASAFVSKFYADKTQKSSAPEAAEKNKLLDKVLDLPPLVTTCLSEMIKHLTNYGLEHVFDLTKYFESFSARSHMLLNGNTLTSLEIYRNQTDYTTKGSLFWTLDKTRTKFGRRQLRRWVGRPLLHQGQLEERIKAVEELREGGNPKVDKLKELLSKTNYDLEKGLIRIYYGKCTRPELLTILQTLRRIACAFPAVEDPSEVGFESSILNTSIAALPTIEADVLKFLDVFNHQAAGKDDKYEFFKDLDDYEEINNHKLGIVAVESDLDEERTSIAKTLKKNSVIYVTVSGLEYLIEVPNDKKSLSLVPASWVKISGTKRVSRFHTPTVIRMLRERDQYRESLASACDAAFRRFLATISTAYTPLRDTITSLSTLDCLLSLSIVSQLPGYTKPTFVSTPTINITAGRHPMVEQLLDTYIPNSIHLSPTSHRALLITGPNMGGKSSYVRQTALICIMAQIGSYVPADAAELGLCDAVFTRMGAFDNMMSGESTFMVELSETSDILKAATPRSLIILDELGRGTSTHDGVAIAHAVFDYVVKQIGAMCLFVTHYPLLARFGDVYPDLVSNTHMAFEEAGDGESVTFLYQVAEGVAHRSYGLNVARLAGLPEGVLKVAGEKSRELEERMGEREAVGLGRAVLGMARGDVDMEALLGRVEGLVV